jgi:alpha-1,3-rhamnosyltransferase
MFTKKNKSPLVSVVIPCYNHDRYVQLCIESVIDQDYENIELIIIDDGSSDQSPNKIRELVAKCERRFERFHFRERQNKGLCATLNEALEWCEGDYYTAIASDDLMYKNKISLQLEELNNSPNFQKYCAVFSGFEIVDNKGTVKSTTTYKKKITLNFRNYYGRRWLCASTALIKMSAIKNVGRYDDTLSYEDLDMWIRLLKKSGNFLVLPEALVGLRKHENNMSNNRFMIFKGELKTYWKHRKTILFPLAIISLLKTNIRWIFTRSASSE